MPRINCVSREGRPYRRASLSGPGYRRRGGKSTRHRQTSSYGVDPASVGNIQSAQKTLSVIGGAILRHALGEGSQITDAKIEASRAHATRHRNRPAGTTADHGVGQVAVHLRARDGSGRCGRSRQGREQRGSAPNILAGLLPHDTWALRRSTTRSSGEMQQPDGRQPARDATACIDPPAADSTRNDAAAEGAVQPHRRARHDVLERAAMEAA